MRENENVLRIIKETLESVKNKNYSEIKSLSNQTINTASFTQDPDNIMVAVVVYSLYKIFEREDYQKYPGWKVFYDTTIQSLNHSIKDIEIGDFYHFRKDFERIRNVIKKVSGKFKKYIEEVFRNARISKASRIYEHGISMEQTAKLLGITLFELAEYAGQTGIPDVLESKTITESSRIKLAMDFFK